MKVLVSFGLRPIENGFFNESLFFGLRPIENVFFNESVCFFGLKPSENGFFNENVCCFGLRHCGRRCCALFSFEFVKTF